MPVTERVEYVVGLRDQMSRKLRGIQGQTRKTDKAMAMLNKTMMRFVGVAAVGRVMQDAAQKNLVFEKSISNLSAITGATGEQLEFLSEQAKLMGSTTSKSAAEAAEAMKLIASAKPELLENSEALAAVTKEAIVLAEASGLTLPNAAANLSKALNSFDLAASQSSRVINSLAAGSKFASAEIPDLTASLGEFGGVAASLNISLEESVAAVEAVSGKIAGSRAGIQMRNVFLRLAKSADQNLNPAVVGLSQALENLAPIQDDVNKLSKLFGVENVLTAQTLIKQRDRFDELTKAVTGTNIAYEQAITNTNNLAGDIDQLKGAWEGFLLSDEGTKGMRGIVKFLEDTVRKLSNLDLLIRRIHKLAPEKQGEAFDLLMELNEKQGQQFRDVIGAFEGMSIAEVEMNRERIINALDKHVRKINRKEAEALFEVFRSRKEAEFMKIFDLPEAGAAAEGGEGGDGTPTTVTPTTAAIKSITGAAPKVFNINIEKLIETQEINTTNLEESASEVKIAITRAMGEALADVQPITE